MAGTTQNLLGMTRGDLESLFVDMGEKPFRARQVMQWIYGRSVYDLENGPELDKQAAEAKRKPVAAPPSVNA